MKYLIAILLPSPVDKSIRSIQERFRSPRWQIRLPPHITISPPFVFREKEEQLIELIKELLPPPFPLQTGSVETFNRRYQTIYLSLKPSLPLKRLQQSLVRTLTHLNESKTGFTPHITLANQLTHSEAKRVVAALSGINLSFDFICNNITLLQISPKDKYWQVVKDFPLPIRNS